MKKISCHLCGGDQISSLFNYQNLMQCQNCKLIFVKKKLTNKEIKKLYSRIYFHCHSPEKGGYENYLADEEDIKRTFRRRLDVIEKMFKIR